MTDGGQTRPSGARLSVAKNSWARDEADLSGCEMGREESCGDSGKTDCAGLLDGCECDPSRLSWDVPSDCVVGDDKTVFCGIVDLDRLSDCKERGGEEDKDTEVREGTPPVDNSWEEGTCILSLKCNL